MIQESARIVNPDPANFPYFAADVAVDGDDAIATLERYFDVPEGGNPNDDAARRGCPPVPSHHRRMDADPAARPASRRAFTSIHSGLAMQNGIAALAMNPLYIFERRNGDWVSAPITGVDPAMPGDSIAVDGTRILYGGTGGQWSGTLYEKNAAGIWRRTSIMLGDYRGGDDEYAGGPVDISGDRAVVLSPYNEEEFPVASPGVTVFREWADGTLPSPSPNRDSADAPLGYEVAVRGDEIFIAGNNSSGTHVYRPAPSDSWEESDTLLRARQPHGRRRHLGHPQERSSS